VLDAWSVLAFLEGAAAAGKVGDLIADAQTGGQPLLMTTVTLAEVECVVARSVSLEEAGRMVAELRRLGVQTIDVDWELARVGADVRSRHRLPLGDALTVGLARLRKAELVTGDQRLKPLEDEIKIQWLE